MRQAVLTSGDADALWAWVRTRSGEEDLVAWQRLLRASTTRTRAAAWPPRGRPPCAAPACSGLVTPSVMH